ncbi:hypothetical protein HMPREF9946_03150 [Acetobacteraceae bacterium AT-5844]|nr:hypothetical protein HMPREF9946_03150 [Acetobacteraceae bacterium AT-5844]
MSDDFTGAIEAAVGSILSDINTSMPGVIVSYDAGRNRAVVRPTLPKRLADGTTLEAPTIAEVPVLWPTGGGGSFTFPIRPGDQVWLEFSQRSLDGWLGGNDTAPDDPRRFDLSDCVARPGGGRDVSGVDADAVALNFGGASVRLEPDGTVRIIGNLVVEGASVTHNGVNIGATHAHQEVERGGEISGPPVP